MLVDLGLISDVTMARQDSGQLERFAAIFAKQNKMASEIETFADVEEALRHGYVAAGAGGFFGEKRRSCKAEFSIAGKLVKAIRQDSAGVRRVGYAGKLGDASAGNGSWAEYDVATSGMPAKFIVSSEAPRGELWHRMLAYARKGDEAHDRQRSGGPQRALLCKRDADRLVAELSAFCSSPYLADARFVEIVERMHGYATKIRAASSELPDTPPGETTLTKPVDDAMRRLGACSLPLKALVVVGGIATALLIIKRR